MALATARISSLLQPYIVPNGSERMAVGWDKVCDALAIYLELMLKWNARMNLTAIRRPEEIVARHFGESLFVGQHLGECSTLMDFGSGGGLPGIPMQILRPDVQVTLAESQGKKAAFLREVVRELRLSSEVWDHRVEEMPPDRLFDVVTLRAVDRMAEAIEEARARAVERLMILGTKRSLSGYEPEKAGRFAVPDSQGGILLVIRI